MPKGTAKKTIETLAWSAIKNSLTSPLKAAIVLLDPLKVPDTSTWQRLDEASATFDSHSDTSVVMSATVSEKDDQQRESLFEKINQLEVQVANLKTSSNNVRFTCFRCGTEGHMARSCPQSQLSNDERQQKRNHSSFGASNRGESQYGKTESSLCFYHNKFGRSAQKCVQPCSWQKNY